MIMEFELSILGSSSAVPTSLRNTTAQVLKAFERFFLIDCGEGTQRQMRIYKIPFERINNIFISHLHGDHCYGLIALISSLGLKNRTTPLHIYSHRKLEKIINCQLDLLNVRLPYEIIFHEIDNTKTEIIYEDKRISVTAFPLKHRDIPTSGFLFKEKEHLLNLKKDIVEALEIPISWRPRITQGEDYIDSDGKIYENSILTHPRKASKSFAFCSDTAFTEKFVDTIKDVDLLYHEATYANDNKHLAKKYYHSTAEQAAIIAKKANAKKLIMGHFSTRYKKARIFEEEAREIFTESYSVNDGDKFEF